MLDLQPQIRSHVVDVLERAAPELVVKVSRCFGTDAVKSLEEEKESQAGVFAKVLCWWCEDMKTLGELQRSKREEG